MLELCMFAEASKHQEEVCAPMSSRLQPYVREAATLYARDCNPKYARLRPDVPCLQP